MKDGRSLFTSARLPIVTAVLATGIFIADTVTRVDIAFAVLYVAVVLLSARFCRPSGVAIVAAGCAALTILSYLITRTTGPAIEGVVNALISLGAIVLITPLVLRDQSRELALREARDAARRSEKEFRTVLDTMPAIAFSARPDGFNDFQNRRWLEYSGLSTDASLGNAWHVGVHPDDLEPHVSKWQASLASGEPFEDEVRHRSANDEYRWFLTRAVPLRDEHGKVLKWYGILTDIEDRKRAEEALRRSEAHLAQAQRLTHTGSWARSPKGEAYWSEEMFRIWGFDPMERPPEPDTFRQRVHPDDRDRLRENGEKAMRGGTGIDDEYRILLPDGTVNHIHAVGRPILSTSGEMVELVGTVVDVTERKRAQEERERAKEALRRSEAYLAEAQKLTHTGTWARSALTGELLYCSDEFSRIFGFDPQGPLPTMEMFRQRVHPEDRERIREKFLEKIRREDRYVNHFRVLLPDGTIKYIQTVGYPLVNSRGEIDEYIGINVDVTEHQHAEEERERLRQLEANLAHMNRVSVMGEMSASLAHELKQPMAAAVMNAEVCLELLQRSHLDISELRDASLAVVKSAKRAADIIDSVRSLSRRAAPKRELADFNEIICEIDALLHNQVQQNSVTVLLQLAENLPAVRGDRVQLQQVVMNLMLNGIEAMTESGGDLIVRSVLTEAGQVLVSVSDTGVGLPNEKKEHIFDAFFTTKPQGTGMGLAISRSIIESHGGRLWAMGNACRGATFYFELPHQAPEPA
jgi:PAS domain S-box-containing protein